MSETKTEMVELKLTRTQCKNVAELIEFRLIDEIREDASIDNIQWVEDMVDAMRILKWAAGKGEDA